MLQRWALTGLSQACDGPLSPARDGRRGAAPGNREGSRNAPESQVCLRDARERVLGNSQTSFLPHKREQPLEDPEQLLWRRKPAKRGGGSRGGGAGAELLTPPGIWSQEPRDGPRKAASWKLGCVTLLFLAAQTTPLGDIFYVAITKKGEDLHTPT